MASLNQIDLKFEKKGLKLISIFQSYLTEKRLMYIELAKLLYNYSKLLKHLWLSRNKI